MIDNPLIIKRDSHLESRISKPLKEYYRLEGLAEPVAREVSCRIIAGIVKYLEAQGYRTASLFQGLPFSRDYLCDPFNWIDHHTREIIFQRAVEISTDESVMYQMGIGSPALKPFGGLENLVTLLGNPRTAYASIPRFAPFFDHTLKFKTTFTGENQALIEMHLSKGYRISKNSCYFAQGMLSAIPALWGLPPAEISEEQCLCEKYTLYESEKSLTDHCCRYDVSWQPAPPVSRRFWEFISGRRSLISSAANKLEENFRLMDQKNAELSRKNQQLAVVRELALALEGLESRDEVYSTVVDMARNIPGVCFAAVLKTDASGDYFTTPYYSPILDESVLKRLEKAGFEFARVIGEKPESCKFKFSALRSRLDRNYLNDRQMFIGFTLSDLLEGLYQKEKCDKIQRAAGFQQLNLVPVVIEGEPWSGLLFFLNDKVFPLILSMVGSHCASALKSARSREKLEKRNAELAALNRIAGATSSYQDILPLLDAGLQEIHNIYNAGAGAIYLWDESFQKLKLAAAKGISEAVADSLCGVFQSGSTIFRYYSDCENILLGHLPAQAFASGLSECVLEGSGSVNYVVGKIVLRSKRLGIITLIRSSDQKFTKNEIELLNSISSQLAMVIENTYLHSDILRRMHDSEKARLEIQEALEREKQALLALKTSEESLLKNQQRFKKLYEEEKKERTELQEESKARSQFISVLAHELRTPLTPILLSVELLNDMLSDNPESIQHKLIHNTYLSVQSLKERLEELLDLARYSRGAFKLNAQLLDTSSFLERIARNYIPVITSKKQSLEIQIEPNLLPVEGDPSLIEQVLLNLLSNASKYSPEKSIISLKASARNLNILVEVHDLGSGIAPEDQYKLFLPYHRAEQDRQSYPGIGLGLAVSRQIIEAHNGRIWVESERGKGCTFIFILPSKTGVSEEVKQDLRTINSYESASSGSIGELEEVDR